MCEVKTLVLRTAGTNCDVETQHAFLEAGSKADMVHVNRLISGEKTLSEYDILAIPGGFTYGDDIASGKILANEMRHLLQEDILDFIESGKLVIGICNGFQVLVKMGILPNVTGSADLPVEATLQLNDSGIFTAKWVYLKRYSADENFSEHKCVWTGTLPEIVYMPIAHAEGKFVPANEKVLTELHRNGQIVFQYCDRTGKLTGPSVNPNGSVENIAGICDPTGRVLGLMPHPERYVSFLQHPNWRRNSSGSDPVTPGAQVFKNGVDFVKERTKGILNGKKQQTL